MQTITQPAVATIPEQTEEYKKGYKDGYALEARPLHSCSIPHLSVDYVRGYNAGYKQASQEGDDAFQAYYSMDG